MQVPHTSFVIAGEKANTKQISFLAKCLVPEDYRYLAYGGAIRGGKSFVVLFALHQLALKYKGSKWLVVRESLPALKKTTIPSFKKLIDCEYYGTWNYSAPISFKYKNGSEILFVPESISQDPDLNAFLGLECNGIFLEQLEELSMKMWQMAIQRAGSLYIEPMPPNYIFTTFNPNQGFSKELFYLPFINGELEAPFFYMPALPTDNAHVTKDQYSAWDTLDDRYKKQMIEGSWVNFDLDGKRWAYAYDEVKHKGIFDIIPNLPLILSFDFNKNPICCSVLQIQQSSTIWVHETIKLETSDIYQLCDYIIANYGNRLFKVTGDASGNSTSAMVKDNLTYYLIIRTKLNLSNHQMDVPSVNPSLEDNRVLVNSLLSRGNVHIHETKAAALHFDLANVKVDPDGSIDKSNRKDPTKQADALDTFRYGCNTYLKNFIYLPDK